MIVFVNECLLYCPFSTEDAPVICDIRLEHAKHITSAEETLLQDVSIRFRITRKSLNKCNCVTDS